MTALRGGRVVLVDPLPGLLVALSASPFPSPPAHASLDAHHAVSDSIITVSSVSKDPAPVERTIQV